MAFISMVEVYQEQWINKVNETVSEIIIVIVLCLWEI